MHIRYLVKGIVLILLLPYSTAKAEAWVPNKKKGYRSIGFIYNSPISSSETKLVKDEKFYLATREEKYTRVFDTERGIGRNTSLIGKLVYTTTRTRYTLDVSSPKGKFGSSIVLSQQKVEPLIGIRKRISEKPNSATSINFNIMPFEYLVPQAVEGNKSPNSYLELGASYGISFQMNPRFNYSYFEFGVWNKFYLRKKHHAQRLKATLGHKLSRKTFMEMSILVERNNYQYLYRPLSRHNINAYKNKIKAKDKLEEIIANHLVPKSITYNNYKVQLKLERSIGKKKFLSLSSFVDFQSNSCKPYHSMMISAGKYL